MKLKNFRLATLVLCAVLVSVGFWLFTRPMTAISEKNTSTPLPSTQLNQVELPRTSPAQPNSGITTKEDDDTQAKVDLANAMASEESTRVMVRERYKHQIEQELQKNITDPDRADNIKTFQEELTDLDQPVPAPTVLGKLELVDGVPMQITLGSGEPAVLLATVQANGHLRIDFSRYIPTPGHPEGRLTLFGSNMDAKPGERVTTAFSFYIFQYTPIIKPNAPAAPSN